MEDLNFTNKDALETLAAVQTFLDETTQIQSKIFKKYGGYFPSDNSIAAKDMQIFPKKDSVQNVYKVSFLKMDCAADYLMLIIEGFTPPSETISPWVCVRGILELCAQVSWLLNPNIDIQTRINRFFAVRYDELKQQQKISVNCSIHSKDNEKKLDSIKRRMKFVMNDGLSLGCPEIKNNNKVVTSIGERIPHITDLVKETLNREFEYRISSAVAHGDIWAMTQMGYQQNKGIVPNEEGVAHLEKHITPEGIVYAFNISVTAFSQCLWYWWKLYGWNQDELIELLDRTFDSLNYSNSHRIWHPKY